MIWVMMVDNLLRSSNLERRDLAFYFLNQDHPGAEAGGAARTRRG